MKMYLRPMLAVAAMTSVSACMGGGGGDDIVTSNGILLLEVPDQGTYAELDGKLQQMVDRIIESNESSDTATQPAGNTSYSGLFGMVFDGDGALVSGAATLTVDNALDMDYTFFLDDIKDAGNPDATVSGTLTGSANAGGGTFNGGLVGNMAAIDFDGPGGPNAPAGFTVGGNVTGAFDADGDAFGQIEGTAGAESTPFVGLFHATQNP